MHSGKRKAATALAPQTQAQLDQAVQRAFEDLSAAALNRGAASRTVYGGKKATAQARREALKRLDTAAREYHRLMMLAVALGQKVG